MGREVSEQIAEYERTRESNRGKITSILNEVGEHYKGRKVAELTLHQGHDIHAFYRLTADPSRVIHVQGYPGMSSEGEMHVWARMMDYERMMSCRAVPNISVGNEHEAVTARFENFGSGMGLEIPYDAAVLENLLAENVPELR